MLGLCERRIEKSHHQNQNPAENRTVFSAIRLGCHSTFPYLRREQETDQSHSCRRITHSHQG